MRAIVIGQWGGLIGVGCTGNVVTTTPDANATTDTASEQMCLAPLAPLASLKAGVCKKVLPMGTAASTTGPVGTFAVGWNPTGIAFDGTNMWVTNVNGVSELSPAGTPIGTFADGSGPSGIALDGVHMWIANQSSGTVTEM